MAGKGSAPGERRGGRQKGTPNKLTASIKAAVAVCIEDAFHAVGGADYLRRVAESDPAVFCTLLGKVLPAQIQHSGGISMLHSVDRPTNEPREAWIARHRDDLLAIAPPAGSAE